MNIQEKSSSEQQVISVGEWVLYLFLFSIPVINIIVMVIWAFGNEPNPTKKNFARASLIWIVIAIIFSLLIMTMFYGIYYQAMSSMQGM